MADIKNIIKTVKTIAKKNKYAIDEALIASLLTAEADFIDQPDLAYKRFSKLVEETLARKE